MHFALAPYSVFDVVAAASLPAQGWQVNEPAGFGALPLIDKSLGTPRLSPCDDIGYQGQHIVVPGAMTGAMTGSITKAMSETACASRGNLSRRAAEPDRGNRSRRKPGRSCR